MVKKTRTALLAIDSDGHYSLVGDHLNVAVPDNLLDETTDEMKKRFPDVAVLKARVCVVLHVGT